MMARTKVTKEPSQLVQPDPEWLKHIQGGKSPDSHKIFTNPSYYSSFWENAEHSIILIDEDGGIIAANPYFCDLVAQTPADLKQHSFFELIDRRYFKRDIVNIKEVINSNIYAYTTDTQMENQNNNKAIPVQMIATRIPATLNQPFKHIVVHLYELKNTAIIANPDYEKIKNGIYGWKELFFKPWFIKMVFAFLALVALLLALTGHFGAIVEHLIEKYAN